MKRNRITGLIVVLLALVAGCDDDNNTTTGPGVDNGPYNLSFTGTIAPHAGQMLRVLVIKDDDGSVVGNEMLTVAGDGTFSLSWSDALIKGESYHIDFYADHNSSGTCDSPPADHAWRETISAVAANVSRDFQHNTNFTDVCGSFKFDLDFTGNIAPHAGQMLHVAVIDEASSIAVQTADVTVAGNGVFAFSWPGILEDGRSYRVDFYADHNSSGTCDSPPTDHAWRRLTGVVRDHAAIDFPHDTNFTDVCASFP